MTFTEMYASLKVLYKNMMFPKTEFLPGGQAVRKREWTMTEIDQLDVHFFFELMAEFEELEEHESSNAPRGKEVYLSDVW